MHNFRNKKVLLLNLGLLGGGATAKWLLDQGVRLTITDFADEKVMAPAMKVVNAYAKKTGATRRLTWKIGNPSLKLVDGCDMVVINPSVSINDPHVQHAIKKGKPVINEVTIFYNSWPRQVVGVTGTRGKTTTTHWITHFLNAGLRATIAGNSMDKPFLKVLDQSAKYDIAVAETPSFQLEFFDKNVRTPDIAVITNISPDHLNRHGTLENYAGAKANLFRHQKKGQCVVLNADNPWTKFFLKQKPKSYVWLFSKKSSLPRRANGVFCKNDAIWYQFGGHKQKVLNVRGFVKEKGEHNLENLLASSLVAYLAGSTGKQIKDRLATLPDVPFRQQIVFTNSRLTIINDTTATSPEGGIAALKRFSEPSTILIAGGTDRQLDFKEWAKAALKHIKPANMIFLSGSATDKILKLLGKRIKPNQVFDTLAECLVAARKQARKYKKSVVLFSPAAKSFEKFKNEYDRGAKFNRLVKAR